MASRGPANRGYRSRLRRSGLRHRARLGVAGLLAGVAGLAGMAIGAPLRALGFTRSRGWGRALWRRLVGRAAAAREQRDAAADAALGGQADGGVPQPIGDQVRRAVGVAPDSQTTTIVGDEMTEGVFDFRRHAEEMHAAALTAQPGGMMEVLSSFDGMPTALEHVALTFDVIMKRAEEELPLNPAVIQAIEGVRKLITDAASAAEDISATFRAAHAEDIARHTDPRPGEGLWDTVNN